MGVRHPMTLFARVYSAIEMVVGRRYAPSHAAILPTLHVFRRCYYTWWCCELEMLGIGEALCLRAAEARL